MRECLVAIVLLAALPAQALRGPVGKPMRFETDPATADVTNLVVKFVEGSAVRLRAGAFHSAAGRPLGGVTAALRDAAVVERLFAREEAELEAERARLLRSLAERAAAVDPPADLNLYYRVRFGSEAAGRAAWRALCAEAVVETAFPDTPPGYAADPQDIPPTTPDYAGGQGFFAAGPAGIGMHAARALPGGRGEPLQICDIETGLIVAHEDIPQAIAANVIGANPTPRDHGLAVAGLLVADKNGYGVTGGVHRARYRFHSHLSANWASSVNVAAAHSQPGDIIVLEVQLPCPGTGSSGCPMEGRQDVFDAVRNATLAGIHVVAAAGNGSHNLDSAAFGGAFDRSVRDSGAVIVGATDGSALVRAAFSNYGAIVDANGWGYSVVTTGYGDLFFPASDPRQLYTATFSGTSSATPIVVSAAAAALGAAAVQLGLVLTPAQLRGLLRTHGTAVATIGQRPDVGQLLASLGLPAGLTLRNEASLGGAVTLDVTAAAGELWFLLGAFAPGLSVQPFGRILLDPAHAVVVASGAGTGSYALMVPADPVLRGSELHWQAARFHTVAGAIRLSSSVVSHFER